MNGGTISGMTKVKQLSFLQRIKLNLSLGLASVLAKPEDAVVPAVKEAKEELVLAGKKVIDKYEPKTDSIIHKYVPQNTKNVVRPKGVVRTPEVVTQHKGDSIVTEFIPLNEQSKPVNVGVSKFYLNNDGKLLQGSGSQKIIYSKDGTRTIAKIEQKPKVDGPKGKVIIPDEVAKRKGDDIGTASKKLGE